MLGTIKTGMSTVNKLLFLFIIIVCPRFTFGQVINEADTVNYVDSNRLKQGAWVELLSFQNNIDSIECHLNYLDGSKTSKCECLNKNGTSVIRGNYIMNEETGIWLFFKDNGLLDYRIKFHNGQLENKVIYEYMLKDNKLETSKMTYVGKNDSIIKIEYYENYILTRTKNPKATVPNIK
jgi:antitoxin component YwqK of YwqJK toxin-antitoxin module